MLAFDDMRRILAQISALLLISAQIAPAQEVSNRDLYRKSLTAAYQAMAQYGSYDDLQELRRVNDIGYRIARESGFNAFPFTFHLIDMPEPNAFALPGGHIFITRGMLELDLDDDMLAGLLGHEIAHVVMGHGIRMQKRATLLNALSQALLVGVMIAASSDSGGSNTYYDPRDPRSAPSNKGDMIQGTYAAGIVVTELLLRSYSREFEDESDEEGQRWAAGAGFDPSGTRTLMARMADRIPQTQDYGYWQTHPFFAQRVQAAEARQKHLTIQEPEDATEYRIDTQTELLTITGDPKIGDELDELLRWEALNAWPRGARAEAIRLDYLHRARDKEKGKPELSQDIGALIGLYREEMDEVRQLTPESKFLGRTGEEVVDLEVLLEARYPEFVTTWETGVFETEFLETFLSNYPDSALTSEVALSLGDAYSRSRRQSDAVSHYLVAFESAPEGEAGQRASAGLRNLVGFLDQLGALQQLADQRDDPELRRLADERLDRLADSYDTLENGAEYLKRFPHGPYAKRVNERLEILANEMLGELLLYQSVGDTVKALERIRKILTYAPLSPAANRLRQQAVFES